MSTRMISLIILACDGCEAEHLSDATNATEARASAYGEGWRFPNKVNDSGKTLAGKTSDVCPGCLPGWAAAVTPSRKWTPEQREWMSRLAKTRNRDKENQQ